MRLILLTLAASAALFAQTTVPVKMCFTPTGGSETCYTFQPGSTAMITVDLRNKPVPAVVVQPLPAYQIKAMQDFVDGQTYNIQQPGGELQTVSRYQNVQDLLVEHLIKNVIASCLKLYPATGGDAGKQAPSVLKTDLLTVLSWFRADIQ